MLRTKITASFAVLVLCIGACNTPSRKAVQIAELQSRVEMLEAENAELRKRSEPLSIKPAIPLVARTLTTGGVSPTYGDGSTTSNDPPKTSYPLTISPTSVAAPARDFAYTHQPYNQAPLYFATPPTPSYSYAVPAYRPGPFVAENGSYYGEPNEFGVPKTVPVQGYFRRDGTYVQGHYRSRPR